MNELFPLTAGALLGMVLRRTPAVYRTRLLAVLGLVFGLLASLISGEFRMSLSFWILDSLLVIGAAAAIERAFRTAVLRH